MAINASSPNHPPLAASLSPPWTQIVASAAPPSATVVVDTPSVTPAVEDIDNNSGENNANIGQSQRIVWNKPSNASSSSVMDAESWPALSESAKAPAKSPPPPSLEVGESSLDASTLPQLQGTGTMLPFPRDRVRDTASMNNRPPMPIHQRPYRRPNPNMTSNGGYPSQFSAPQGSIAVPPGSHNHAPNYYPPRAGFVPNDQPHHRNSFKYRGGGQHQRGDGFHHQNYGGRRDQVRGNQDLNAHQRNNYRSPSFVPPFVRPPPPANTAQYYVPPPPQPVWPFGGSYGYYEPPSQVLYRPSMPMEPLGGVPFVPSIPPNAMTYQPFDPKLYTKIVSQIDYYFSDQNLINDVYLKGIMDNQGWVPLNLIAGFKLVAHLTDNIQIVFDAVRTSSVVEMQGGKIRRRHGWWKWITPSTQSENVTSSEAVGELANRVQNIDLEKTENQDHSASAQN
ncbi:unnamed protein product [Vicia faba]|uniref:HTH La-type RNA-binding domain-containing protein n=1 Tax=Vicia faba TaxID=3906 RepID=A0AAV1AEE2_VICFA|nr:unnamed protein product [Vicia faba]